MFVLFFWLGEAWHFVKMWRRGNWRLGFGQRFALYSPEVKAALGQRPVVWLHAVSVGEVGVCLQLLRGLEPSLPGFQFVVSTTTSTGMGELRRRLPPHVQAIYYPSDLAGVVHRALNTIRPKAIILIEAELWPNLLWQAQDRDIPLFLVNARLSERSFKGYTRFSALFRPIFSKFRGVGCQQSGDAGRLLALGFLAEAVCTVGNMKFDAAQPDARPGLDVSGLLRQIGVKPNTKLLVAGSTHAGEEAILAEMWPRLRKRFPNLFLIIVPRHFERAKEAAQELSARGIPFVYRSKVSGEKQFASGQLECLLVNSTGELKFFYEHATVVFVGKSLTAEGGQNPIEPAALGQAMVFGPNMQNFKAVVGAFLAEQAAIQVQDAAGLEQAVAELLSDDQRRSDMGARALQVVRKNLGATDRTVQLIAERLQT
ncbi:MAG TPA: 3-deoxy-D-manno-octulosonic acid transferase [Verrucomicrobiae bacterium]|nr:3-deoxy-D-manno-octulosonic acid transferase [Verrucomicrobiae bacterium]